MKTKLAILGVTALTVTSIVTPNVFASTKPQHTMQRSEITVNGSLYESMYTFAAKDGGNLTTYMPIWYVQQLINRLFNIDQSSDTWDGQHWRLTLTGVTPTETFGNDNAMVYVNGVEVESAPSIVDIDPASGIKTTFVPIWYVQQLLNRLLNIGSSQDSWDGEVWALIQSVTETGAPTNQVVDAFAKALGVNASTFTAPNTPNMTIGQIDQMYWDYIGISSANTQYQPGGNVTTWGNDIGLNAGLSGTITESEMSILQANLTKLNNGFYNSSGAYHVEYTPADEWVHTFKGAVLPPSVQTAITQTYAELNSITFTASNGYIFAKAPSYNVHSLWDLTVGGGTDGSVQYSFDNGKTWRYASSGYDSYEGSTASTSTPNTVMFKAPGRMGFSFNEYYGSGNIELANLLISSTSNGVSVERININ